ncbi:MAG TPA: membrane protein insertase YidC [Rhodanobacteraceae bacterium]|nr:membrane protein insertase YidC [Rhodanobacteraceae bacterium]
MINQTRTLLVVALCFVAWLIWNQWQQDYAPQPVQNTAQQGSAAAVNTRTSAPAKAVPGEVPVANAPAPSGSASTPAASTAPAIPEGAAPSITAPHQYVTLSNDVLRLTIDTRGGSVVRADLLSYPKQVKGDTSPVRLLSDDPQRLFVAQDGLVGANGSPAPDHLAMFTAGASSYSMQTGANEVTAELTWRDPSGVSVSKRYTLKRGSYVVQLAQQIDNRSARSWAGNAYEQIERVEPPAPPKHFLEFYDPERSSFLGAAWYSQSDKFEKLAFDKFEKDPLNHDVQGGWVAMIQHYFFAAWIPPSAQTDQFSSAKLPPASDDKPRYLIRARGPGVTVAPGHSDTLNANLYVGPKTQSTLSSIAPGLELTIDYGVFTVIAQPLFWILSKFHAFVGNWGVAIILLVLLIKALFFKLTEQQYKAGAKMRKLTPRIKALKERFGEDKQKQQQAMMELYKKEKVNPMAGCLPSLVQIPVFFALYYVLMYSVELRHAPFFGWIHDLSAPDPYFILPALYTVTMIATQFLTPAAGMDPTQAKIMKVMPIVFAVMFAFFPAGLTLYYVVNGLTSVIQQWVITRSIERADARARA